MVSIELVEPKTGIDYEIIIKKYDTNVSRFVRGLVKDYDERQLEDTIVTTKENRILLVQNISFLILGLAFVTYAMSIYFNIPMTFAVLFMSISGLLIVGVVSIKMIKGVKDKLWI
jgi:hypothetical protein